MTNPLENPLVVSELARAWEDSQADDPIHRHEEGGYILMLTDGSVEVGRWARGGQDQIMPPSLGADGRYNGNVVLATFHTHPNPPMDEGGEEWQQEPSAGDRRWHARRKLRGYVIGAMLVYLIDEDGVVAILGERKKVLSA